MWHEHCFWGEFPEAKVQCFALCVSIIQPFPAQDHLGCSNWSCSFWCNLPSCLATCQTAPLTSRDVHYSYTTSVWISCSAQFSLLAKKEIGEAATFDLIYIQGVTNNHCSLKSGQDSNGGDCSHDKVILQPFISKNKSPGGLVLPTCFFLPGPWRFQHKRNLSWAV